MNTLAIDIETYSGTDIKTSGVYKYVEDPDFSILLFAYSFNGNPVHIVDLENFEEIPSAVLQHLTNQEYLKTAFNANFERTCIAKYLDIELPADQWECSMMKASMLGLPLSLEATAKVLELDEQKAAGKALIKFFTQPCKPTKVNGMRTRNYPEHAPEKWEDFKNYCVQDVVTEQAIRSKISFFNIPPFEKQLWYLDQKINDTGIGLDRTFIDAAMGIDQTNRIKLTQRAIELTGLNNPNSAAQLKEWLSTEMPLTVVDTLKKEDIPVLLSETDSDTVTEVLNIRQEMSKTSIKKYGAMLKGICVDKKLRGIHQFYGANRTGRWAGRLVQPQNLPKNFLEDLDLARSVVNTGDTEMVEMLFGNVPDTLSQLIRTAFIASENSRFIVADFSAIEARVIAWLAGEKWRLDVFNTHGKIYEASASQMFKVPLESVTKGSDLRQKGKVSELALGYQGGPNALIKMGALKMGIDEDELPRLVKMWRNANKAIVKLWSTVDNAALKCVIERTPVQIMFGIRFSVENNILFIALPSGRRLSYQQPHIREGQYGDMVCYWGMDQTTKQWTRQDTYGGKLVENLVQAIARDCLADALIRVDSANYKICMHVHDEIVCDQPNGQGSLNEINKIMGAPISWAPGLPLNADSYETVYYKKD